MHKPTRRRTRSTTPSPAQVTQIIKRQLMHLTILFKTTTVRLDMLHRITNQTLRRTIHPENSKIISRFPANPKTQHHYSQLYSNNRSINQTLRRTVHPENSKTIHPESSKIINRFPQTPKHNITTLNFTITPWFSCTVSPINPA